MSVLRSLMIWTGGAALLAATALDTLVVIGRQAGFALHGAIELIQAAVLVAGSLALIAATAANNHARVRLVINRLSASREWLERGSELLTALFFAALLAGSGWLALDLWNSHEVSEIAGVPWRLLRLFANLAMAAVLVLALRALFKRARQ
jgi:TRAP-type C4-dicarboxylate transport system permease small subunit